MSVCLFLPCGFGFQALLEVFKVVFTLNSSFYSVKLMTVDIIPLN